eukprot:138492_1
MAIVIDNGSHHIKAGFAGERSPRIVFPSIIGEPKHKTLMTGKKYYIGDIVSNRRHQLSVRTPFDHSIINNWDDMENIWEYTFTEQLRVLPQEYRCIISEKYYNPPKNSCQTTEVMFEKFNVPSFYIHWDGILSLYASGNITGVVLDCGHGVTCCTPIQQGDVLPNVVRRLDVGGEDITRYLDSLLTQYNVQYPLYMVEKIKAETGRVASNKQELAEALYNTDYDKFYTLPDGTKIPIGSERMQCFEPLFFKNDSNIVTFVSESIEKCTVDLQKRLYDTIILAGGTANCPGFSERFQAQMTALKPTAKVYAPADRRDFLVWIGGSIMASLSSFEQKWITSESYEEYGSSVIHKMTDITTNDSYTDWNYIKGNKAREYMPMSNHDVEKQTQIQKILMHQILWQHEKVKKQKKRDARIQQQKGLVIKENLLKIVSEQRNLGDVKEVLLNRFSVNDICNAIKKWIYNDINYWKHSEKMKEILSNHGLTGKILSDDLSAKNVKAMLNDDLSSYMSSDTLDIMFDCFKKWKHEQPDSVRLSSLQQIACILFHFPLNNLLQQINAQKMDGKAFIKHIIEHQENNIIKTETGFIPSEVRQIESVLFMHYTKPVKAFRVRMDNILTNKYGKWLSNNVINKIKHVIIDEFDIENIYYKIMNQKNIQNFSDRIINLVDEILDNKVTNGYDENFVNKIYEGIAECFVFLEQSEEEILMVERQHWICNNCSNCNVSNYISSRINKDFSICILCGISQRDSVVLQLRNAPTFVMATTVDDDDDKKEAFDDIANIVNTASNHSSFQLFCPNRNDISNKPCPSILRLAKMLIVYKRWIQRVYKNSDGKDTIEETTEIDVAEYISSDVYKQIFFESIANIKHTKVNETHKKLLKNAFIDNVDKISHLSTFLNIDRKWFAQFVKAQTKLKPAFGAKIYSAIKKRLNTATQNKQFGRFISDSNVDCMNKDYHHILKIHINYGNKEAIKSVFQFFQQVVHFEDVKDEIEKCRSFKRTQDRTNKLIVNASNMKDKESKEDEKHSGDTNTWKLKQYFKQSQLDLIHSYLVHSDWKYFIKRMLFSKHSEEKHNDDN